MTKLRSKLLLSILQQSNFTSAVTEDKVYLNVALALLDRLIQFEFISPDDPLGGISVQEIREFLDSNSTFQVKLLVEPDKAAVEIVGVRAEGKIPVWELCNFVALFRHQDEFHVSPDVCFCILD